MSDWRSRSKAVPESEAASTSDWRSRSQHAPDAEAQPVPEPVQALPVEEQAAPRGGKWGEALASLGFAGAQATPAAAVLPRGAFQSLDALTRSMRDGKGVGDGMQAAGDAWTRERNSTGPTALESLRRGSAQGATLGFRDELAGLYGAAGEGVKTGAGLLAKGDFRGAQPEDLERVLAAYRRSRDASRAEDDRSRAANPGAMLTGEIAGGAVIPSGAAASGASLLARMGRGAAAGAGAGLVQGLGASRGGADDARSGALGGGLVGGLVGGTLPGLGAGASRAIEALPQSLKSKASEYALRAAGYIGNDFKRLLKGRGPEGAQAIGRELLDANVIPAGGTVQDVLERIQTARPQAGQAVGDFVERAAATGKQFDVAPLAARVQSEIVDANARSPAMRPMTDVVSKHVGDLLREGAADAGRVPFPLAQKWKTDGQGLLNYGHSWNNAGPNIPADTMQKQLNRILLQEIDDQVEGALGAGSAKQFQAARSRYGALADAEDRAREGAARLAGNAKATTRDLQVGEMLGNAVESIPFVGPLGVGASRIARARSDSLLARGADAAADLAASPAGSRFRALAAALAESGTITPSAARALVAAQEAEDSRKPPPPR